MSQPSPWRLFVSELIGSALLASISGTSTNPARSLGPSIISGQWKGWWIYWIGPLTGAFAASFACSLLARRITVAKLYHFGSDRDGLFRRMGLPVLASAPHVLTGRR